MKIQLGIIEKIQFDKIGKIQFGIIGKIQFGIIGKIQAIQEKVQIHNVYFSFRLCTGRGGFLVMKLNVYCVQVVSNTNKYVSYTNIKR